MDKILGLDVTQLPALLETQKDFILDGLESLTVELKNPDNRKRVTLDLLEHLKSILRSTQDIDIVNHILRIYRTCSIQCPSNQSLLLKSSIIDYIITTFVQDPIPEDLKSFKPLALQVLGNFIVNNPENCATLLTNYDAIDWIVGLLKDPHDTVKDYAAMIGLTLEQNHPALMMIKITPSLIQGLIDGVHLEFPALWLRSLIFNEGFMTYWYHSLDEEYKVKFLHIASAYAKSAKELPVDSLEFLMTCFKNMGDKILTMNFDGGIPDEFNVLEMTTSVEFFCQVIQLEELGKVMKSDKSFVISTIALLRTIHEVGTTGQNCFTPIEKLENLKSESASVASEPGFLFKANLIRLIGSLVEGHSENQDQVRELGVLPVILNCTKVDGRNPFIPQCSVVTLKFLLDGNLSNQAYVQQLQKN